jgi:MFS family permease
MQRSVLSHPDIRNLAMSVGFTSFASRAVAVVIGFQVYSITHSTLALGMLGLVEAIPAITLAPLGGWVADHARRRSVLLATRWMALGCVLGLAAASLGRGPWMVPSLYALVFLVGVARSFTDPTASAFEAEVVPQALVVQASSWISSTWLVSGIVGPAAAGFAYEAWGPAGTYLATAALFALSLIPLYRIPARPRPKPSRKEPMRDSLRAGWRFVRSRQPLIASMVTDLFAVFFGGALALLPVYATDILKAGAHGLGLLNAAPALGSLLVMLIGTRRPIISRAGRDLLLCIAGFGASILVFAFSRSMALSMAALFFSGLFDGVSMLIRRSILRLLTPDEVRGRVAAVNGMFICASNELGAWESGTLAALIGTVPCVAVGGVLTLLVVSGTALFAKELRCLRFDPRTFERI